jgi:starvation-inducible DNA-binding protein
MVVKTEIGLLEKDRQEVARILRAILADEYVLYTKTRNFHWNVTGPNFSELHSLFERQYEALNETVDSVAERIRALGEASSGSLAEFLKETRLPEAMGQALSSQEMLSALLEDHETIIRTLRKELSVCLDRHHDAGTSDFLTGLMEDHEKTAWMLRSYL